MVTGFVQQLSVFGPLLCLWGVVVLGGHTSCRIEHGKLRANPKANALAKRINKAHALAKRIDNVPHTEGTSTTPKHHGETHTVSGCNASSNMSTNKCLVGNARAGSGRKNSSMQRLGQASTSKIARLPHAILAFDKIRRRGSVSNSMNLSDPLRSGSAAPLRVGAATQPPPLASVSSRKH